MIMFIITGLILNMILAFGALYKKAITGLGALAGFVLGAGLFFMGGLVLWTALAFFFISSSFFGRIKKAKRLKAESLVKKSGRRDWIQVFANALPALVAVFLHMLTAELLWLTASFSALAAATADTWASEIGVLARRRPVSILSFKEVDPGISGGVTLLGTLAAGAGSVSVAVIAAVFGAAGFSAAVIIGFCGLFGALLDSVLGAGFQVKYIDSEIGCLTEQPDGNAVAAGLLWMNNDMVNLLSVSSAACASIVFSLLLS